MTPIPTPPLLTIRLDEMVQKWYTDFLEVDQVMLFGLFAAANFLDITFGFDVNESHTFYQGKKVSVL